MKKKETRYNELPINFDDNIYQSKGSMKEKSDYIFSLLSQFFNRFNQFPILLTNQAIPSFQKLFDILPMSFEHQNSQNLLSVIPQFLLCFKPYYSEIPHAELYLKIYDCILAEYVKHPLPTDIETLHILFHSRDFCHNFISTSRLNQLLQTKMQDISNFEKLLTAINSTSLFDEIKDIEDYKKYIIDLYDFASEQYNENNFSDQYFVIFLRFILGIIIRLYNYSQVNPDCRINSEKVFDELLFSSGIFDKINSFLIYLDDGEVTWNLYRPLMICSADPTEMPYDSKIFRQLNKIFVDERFSLKSKQNILTELLHDDIIYESPFCINQTQFPIHLWITKDCVCDDDYFNTYIEIIEKCISRDKSSVLYSIHEFIKLLSPPIQKNLIHYERVFEWMCKIVNPNNFPDFQPINSSIFNDDFFYDSLFLKPELKIVDQYFEFNNYYQLFCFLFDSRRTKYHRKDVITRIFDLINLNHSKYLHHYKMDQMLLANFEVNILNYCIDNITNSKVVSVFNKMNSDIFIRFPQLFRAGNTFSIIEKHLKEDDPKTLENYMCEILLLIHSIVNSSKDMFFDEWVLTLPKESPIFKLKSEIIAPFVFSTSVIFLPSLVPLLPNFDFLSYSPYNHYLLGRYSVPVALKLGIQLANMSQICSRYISFDTYHYLMKSGQIVNLVKRSKTKEEIQCYEFFLGSLPGSITLPTKQSIANEANLIFNSNDSNMNEDANYLLVMFYVKFNSVPTNLFPFLHVSKTTFYVNDDYITYGEKGKKKIKQIFSNVWYLIRVQKTKIMNWTELYIDNKKELTIREAFNFEMIGDETSQVTTSFFVAQNIYATSYIPENSVISRFNINCARSINPILHGGVVSAPIYSISNLLRENFTFLHNFDDFDEILYKSKNRKVDKDKINDFFVFLIQTADYLSDDQLPFFYNRFLLSLMMNPEYFIQFHIVGLIQSILMLKNIKTRTNIFISTLFNLELWHKLDIQLLIYFVEYINNNEATDLDWKLIFTKQNFLYSIHLICYANSKYNPQAESAADSIYDSHLPIGNERKFSFDFDHCSSYTPLFKDFFTFWENVSRMLISTSSSDYIAPILRELSELSCIPEMASMNASIDINKFNVAEVLQNNLRLKSDSENDTLDISIAIRVKTVLFIQKLERNTKQSQIFSNGMLVYFSFFLPVPVAQALFLSLMQIRFEENNSYIIENIPIISKICQRFSDSSLIWSLFVSQLTGDSSFQIDLDTPITKIEVPKEVKCPQIFSILIEMLVSLSAKKSVVCFESGESTSEDTTKSEQSSFINEQITNLKKENALKLMVELFNINDPTVLLDGANLPAFMHLISGERYKDKNNINTVLKASNYSVNIESLDLPNKLSINETKVLDNKLIENKNLFMKLIEKYSYQPVVNLSSEIGLFITTILVKIFISLMEKKPSRLQFYFSLLSEVADDRVLRHTLSNIFLYINGRQNIITTVNLLIDVISNLLIKRKNMFNLKLFNSIINFSISYKVTSETNGTTNNNNNNDEENNNDNTENTTSNFERKSSFNNESNSIDYFKILIPFFILSLNEIGKVDTTKTTFLKLVKLFLERSQLLLEEYQTISIILIYILIKYKVEDFSNGEISNFYQKLKDNYVVTPETPKFWEVIDLTPTYSSLLVTVYFKLSSTVSPLASPSPSANIPPAAETTETTEENENDNEKEKEISYKEDVDSSNMSLADIPSSTYDFTSTSNMNEILSSITNNESTSNFIVLVHESLVQFESFFANWRSSYFEHSYLDLSFRDFPLEQAQTLANNIAYYIKRETMMYFYENRQYYLQLNMRMRLREQLFAFYMEKSITNKSQIGKLKCRSFRASPFAAPTVCPVVCIPSTFSIKTPEQNPADLIKTKSLPLKQSPIIGKNSSEFNSSPLIGTVDEQPTSPTKQQQQQETQNEQKQLEQPQQSQEQTQQLETKKLDEKEQEQQPEVQEQEKSQPDTESQNPPPQQEDEQQEHVKEEKQQEPIQEETQPEQNQQQEKDEQQQQEPIQEETQQEQQTKEEKQQPDQEKDETQQPQPQDDQQQNQKLEEPQPPENQQQQPQQPDTQNPQNEQPLNQEQPVQLSQLRKPQIPIPPHLNQSPLPSVQNQPPQESQYLSSINLLNKSEEYPPNCTKVDFDCDYQLRHYFSTVTYHSSLINVESNHLFDLFKNSFGEITQYHQCTLIRQDFRINSICFTFLERNRCLILTDASSTTECKIQLLEPTPHLSESFLMNEFGPYSMFCGHYVIILDLNNIVMSSKFTSRMKESSLLICSVSNGVFILEFLFFPIIQPSALNLNIKTPQKLWLDNIISTKEYLEIVNFFGMRSFEDFSAYPIFPRVITDIAKFILENKSNNENENDNNNNSTRSNQTTKLEVANVRDLSKPIQIIGFDDTQSFVRNFQSNRFHYFENLSNPITVSSLNLRLAPFCYQQWYLNDGWDKGERNFTSAAVRLSITKKTIDELPPEMFCYPEILMNKNKFRLPSGKLFNLQFPEWCNCGTCNTCQKNGKKVGFNGCKKAPFYFVEYMRYVLEHDDVRTNLNKWIDLNFGDKLMSEEDLTVYHPLSFVSSSSNEGVSDVQQAAKNIEKQRDWMLQCGQVPKRVFDTPHPQFEVNKQLYPADFNPLNFVLVPREFSFVKNLNKFTMNRPNTSASDFAFYPPHVYTASIGKDIVVNIKNNIEFVINTRGNITKRVIDISPSLFFKQHVEITLDFIVVTYSLSLIIVFKIIKTEQGFGVKPIGSLSVTCFKKKKGKQNTMDDFDEDEENDDFTFELKNANKDNRNKNANSFDTGSEICIDANKIIDFNDDEDADFNKNHSFNGDGDVIEDNGVVDYNDDENEPEEFDSNSCYYESKPLFSTLHVKQFLCATVCTSEVIIWCFSTSMIVARINVFENLSNSDDFKDQRINVLTAKFDEEVNVLYLTTSNGELHQYSLNGQLIRKIDLKVGISALEIVPSGFSMFNRFIVTGHTDGSVRILRVDIESREFVIVKEKNMFQLQIAKIISHRDSYSIDVYVIPSRLI